MNFPVYRKYLNNKKFFKILNENEFEEISFIGDKVVVINHIATVFPDKMFIEDLLYDNNIAEMSTKHEYDYYLRLK